MKQSTINFLLGVSAFAGFCFGAYGLYKASQLNNAFVSKVNDVTGKIEVDVPESVIQAATNKALSTEVGKIATREARALDNTITTMVKETVNASKKSITEGVKGAIEAQLKDVNISNLQDLVVESATEQVASELIDSFKTVSTPWVNIKSTTGNNTVDIIKACKDAGMSSWQIQDVIENIS